MTLTIFRCTDVFIFNSGIWADNVDFMDPNDRRDIIKAISDAGMISVYKTTTKNSVEKDGSRADYEVEFCRIADYCFDLSWTYQIPDDDHRIDTVHFNEPIYSVFNVQLLDLLSNIGPKHQAIG